MHMQTGNTCTQVHKQTHTGTHTDTHTGTHSRTHRHTLTHTLPSVSDSELNIGVKSCLTIYAPASVFAQFAFVTFIAN